MINQIHHGDCLKLMQDIPDGSVDMVLSDLPYGTTSCHWDSVIPFAPLWEQYKRVIKPNGAIVLTASQPFTSALVMSNPKWFRYEWIWKKNRGSGHLNAKHRPMLYHESVLIFYKERGTYNPIAEKYSESTTRRFKPGEIHVSKTNVYEKTVYGTFHKLPRIFLNPNGKAPSSVQEFKTVAIHNGERCHPTQKPLALFEYLIRTYTNEGETVLDNCAGSFTTSLAAENTGRNWICIEQEAKYCEIGAKRITENRINLKAAERQLTLY